MRDVDWYMIDGIRGWMSRQECEWLADQASHAKSWVELGTYVGRSAMCVALHLPADATLTVIDKNLGNQIDAGQTWDTTCRQIRQVRPDIHIQAMRRDAVSVAQYFDSVDVVFIDADHTEAGTRAQINAFRGKTKVLCGHDYCESWPGVVAAVDSLVGDDLIRGPGSLWMKKIRNS